MPLESEQPATTGDMQRQADSPPPGESADSESQASSRESAQANGSTITGPQLIAIEEAQAQRRRPQDPLDAPQSGSKPADPGTASGRR